MFVNRKHVIKNAVLGVWLRVGVSQIGGFFLAYDTYKVSVCFERKNRFLGKHTFCQQKRVVILMVEKQTRA
jgi:hypothetical protein